MADKVTEKLAAATLDDSEDDGPKLSSATSGKKKADKKKADKKKGGKGGKDKGADDDADFEAALAEAAAPSGKATDGSSATNSAAAEVVVQRGGEPSKKPHSRIIGGFTDWYLAKGQTEPPTIPVSQLYPDGRFPVGQELDHAGDFNAYRTTSEEKRHLDRMNNDMIESLREAATVHRTVRSYAQSIIKPGIKLADMCEQIENMNRKLVQVRGTTDAAVLGDVAYERRCDLGRTGVSSFARSFRASSSLTPPHSEYPPRSRRR